MKKTFLMAFAVSCLVNAFLSGYPVCAQEQKQPDEVFMSDAVPAPEPESQIEPAPESVPDHGGGSDPVPQPEPEPAPERDPME